MQCGHVEIRTIEVEEQPMRVLHVYVDPRCKNDAERKGHTRLVGERASGEMCMVRMMEVYLAERNGAAEEPLFTTGAGDRMHEDTPNGRLKYWLQCAGMTAQQTRDYGFHSLRAGAATDAHRAGVSEEEIKMHGNWKSDAVKVYIRASTEERLRASGALGRG